MQAKFPTEGSLMMNRWLSPWPQATVVQGPGKKARKRKKQENKARALQARRRKGKVRGHAKA